MGGFACIGLNNPKTAVNVGSAIRAAYCYDAKLIASCGRRYKGSPTDTCKGYKSIPFISTDDLFSVIPKDCVPVAVDLIDGAIPLNKYIHPERAFYIFGAEDQTLGKKITDRCRDIVYIPTKTCMNLAATVNVVLYDRMVKSIND